MNAPLHTPASLALRNDLAVLCRLWEQALGVQPVQADQHFYLAGGDSLQWSALLLLVEQEFGVKLPLSTMSDCTTPEKMLRCLMHITSTCEQASFDYDLDDFSYPASLTQQGLWFSELQAGNCGLYNRAMLLQLQGAVSVPALRAAINAVRYRFPVLRASLQPDATGRTLLMQVQPYVDLPLPLETCSELNAIAEQEVAAAFELSLSLWRFRLLQAAESEVALLVCAHHTACDGWSGQVFLHALTDAYNSVTANPQWQPTLADAAFARHCRQQQQRAGTMLQIDNLRWWRPYLGDADQTLEYWRQRMAVSDWPYRLRKLERTLAATSWQLMQERCRCEQVTLFALLASALGRAMESVDGKQERVIAFPHANRQTLLEQQSIGCYMQLLPLRLRNTDPLAQVHAELLAVQEHAEPWPLLVQALQPKPLPDGSAWTPVMLALHNFPQTESLMSGCKVSVRPIDPVIAQHALTFEVLPSPQGVKVSLSYATELFNQAEMESLLSAWLGLMSE